MSTTRRQFLASGAAMALAGRLGRAAEARPRFTVAMVSDTHLGRKGSESPGRWMRQAVAEINGSAAELTIFLGDLVDTGAKNEARYPEWVGIARGLKRPWYAVPGNHDPEALFRKYVRPKTDCAVDHKGVRFVCFQDTRTDSHQGTVTREQLAWIAGQVHGAATKGLRVVLCAHITAHPNKHPDVGWWVRSGGKEVRELLAANRDTVAACLSGHFHCGCRGWSDAGGVHEVVVPSTCWNRDRGLDKAPGFALKEFRRSYVVLEVHAERLVLSCKPLGAEPVASRALALG